MESAGGGRHKPMPEVTPTVSFCEFCKAKRNKTVGVNSHINLCRPAKGGTP